MEPRALSGLPSHTAVLHWDSCCGHTGCTGKLGGLSGVLGGYLGVLRDNPDMSLTISTGHVSDCSLGMSLTVSIHVSDGL